MPKVITKFKGKKQTHNIPDAPGGFNVLVHQQGIRVDVPAFVEINTITSHNCIMALQQHQWDFIRTGQVFRVLFHLAFDPENRIDPPVDVTELKGGDPGILNVAGMIIQGCEAFFAGKSVFFRNPENGLHPKTERYIVTMFKAMLRMCGKGGTVTTKTKKDEPTSESPVDPDLADRDIAEAIAKLKIKEAKDGDKKVVIAWLKAQITAKGDKPFARIGEKTYTAANLLAEVKAGTDIGKQIAKVYFEAYKVKS